MTDVMKRWNIYAETDFGDEEQRLGLACHLLMNYGLSLASINSAERSGAQGRLIAEIQVVIRRAYEQGAMDVDAGRTRVSGITVRRLP